MLVSLRTASTTWEEEHALRAYGRVGRVFAQGVWLLLAEEVAVRQAHTRLPGRPAKWEAYYQGQPWFRGERSPGEEARLGVCAQEERCAVVLLSERMQRWYEQCVPVEVTIQGTWEVLDPVAYTDGLAQAYQEVRYGRLAALLEPFHDARGLVRCLESVETSRVGRRRPQRASRLHTVQGEQLVQSSEHLCTAPLGERWGAVPAQCRPPACDQRGDGSTLTQRLLKK